MHGEDGGLRRGMAQVLDGRAGAGDGRSQGFGMLGHEGLLGGRRYSGGDVTVSLRIVLCGEHKNCLSIDLAD
ncbi:hypothetical protein ACFFX0_22380 [Citricoccus parietis]|uniref:Uncharacterized protein n=1 Tax=Citricoccus parietis TaxID=592307 RepID=A0ABV5G4D7_9MICC